MLKQGTSRVRHLLVKTYDYILHACAVLCEFVFTIILSEATSHFTEGETKAEQK